MLLSETACECCETKHAHVFVCVLHVCVITQRERVCVFGMCRDDVCGVCV